MANKLLIVESPAKAKTIEKFLGKDFKVKSSYGHIRDLDKGSKGIEIENNFKPNYIISPDKQKVVKDLKEWVQKVDEVWLATDEDREGEAISWHLCEVLNLDKVKTKRIVFREITKPAIQAAVKSPRSVDLNLVNAQQARRVLDRLVGFELSEVLWRKIKNNLSAGRVQSVALRLVVDREREIQQFVTETYYKVEAVFIVPNASGSTSVLKAELNKRFNTEPEAQAFLQKCKDAKYVIESIQVKPTKRNPAPPFTTSTLQQEASRKLGFGVNRTMSAAQKLYEEGWITYMRTDSTFLSATAIGAMADEIQRQFGKEYVHTRQFKSKNELAQEAHEAIRPSYMDKREAGESSDQIKLYELIWKRALASQMSSAELEKTEVNISISNVGDAAFIATGEVLIFDGFLKLYIESKDEEEDAENAGLLPPLKNGQQLNYDVIEAIQRFSRPPARFTEASLVKKLEENGIGRPSTYAPIIGKIMEEGRGYVVKENREGTARIYTVLTLDKKAITRIDKTEITGAGKNALYPTDIGLLVSDYLTENFQDIMNYSFTAEIEKEFDIIADGKLDWVKMITDFYFPFTGQVKEVLERAGKARGRRDLGVDPKTGRTVLVQLSRFGPAAQIGTLEEMQEGEKPQFASLRPGQSMESISYEEVMRLFELPKDMGEFEGKPMLIGVGRFGPYVKLGEEFISIPKGEDPHEISMERAIEIVQEKQRENAPIGTYKELPITKGKGRFGPYLKWNGLFVNVPKRYDFENITFKECIELIDAKELKESKRYIQKWDAEKLAVENGRFGPFIKWGKKFIAIPKVDGNKVDEAYAASLSLEEVKKIVEEKEPGAFEKKVRAKKTTKAKATTEKTTKVPAKTTKAAAKTSKSTVKAKKA